MKKLKEMQRLKEQAEALKLDNHEIINRYTIEELSAIYNGIGPETFPGWLRKFISALHPSLAVVALIHDLEWYESDFSFASFSASNQRFKRNGYKAASGLFPWYNPRRYLVMYEARRFGNLCHAFGWKAWCDAGLARKRQERS